jgi:metallo-beta-lactamase class B
MVKEMRSTGLGNLSDADVKAWPSTIQKVIDKFPSAEVVIPGHGQYGGKELLIHAQELLSK